MQKSLIFLTFSIAIALFFLFFPNVDLFISGLFYNEPEGFFLSRHPVPLYLHKSVKYLTITMAISLFGMLFLTLMKKKPVLSLDKWRVLYLMAVLAIGPGLVVNTVFKDNWGRARPHQTENFGGGAKFTPAFVKTDQCERNCSFTSGDPAVGFAIMALMFVYPAMGRFFLTVGLVTGGILGAARIVMGAHFFSDVVFSGIFVFSVAYLLYFLLKKKEQQKRL